MHIMSIVHDTCKPSFLLKNLKQHFTVVQGRMNKHAAVAGWYIEKQNNAFVVVTVNTSLDRFIVNSFPNSSVTSLQDVDDGINIDDLAQQASIQLEHTQQELSFQSLQHDQPIAIAATTSQASFAIDTSFVTQQLLHQIASRNPLMIHLLKNLSNKLQMPKSRIIQPVLDFFTAHSLQFSISSAEHLCDSIYGPSRRQLFRLTKSSLDIDCFFSPLRISTHLVGIIIPWLRSLCALIS